MPQRVGPDRLGDSGAAGHAADDPGGAVPVQRGPSFAAQRPVSAAVGTVTRVSDRNQDRQLYCFELEPEVRDWLHTLSDSDFKRVDEAAGMLAEKGPGLGGPWSDHLVGPVWELRSAFTR